jgi:uncharacterized membrane-anchored protein
MKDSRKVLGVLILPFLVMLSITLWRAYTFNVGQRIILKVQGYDPRDLLSGHYVVYRVDYGNANMCYGTATSFPKAGYVCLDHLKHPEFSYSRPRSCRSFLKGRCRRGEFTAGIEKFFIPEADAKPLDKFLRESRGSIELSITADGKAQVAELYIDGKPWKEAVK